jgi:hypothetical protein
MSKLMLAAAALFGLAGVATSVRAAPADDCDRYAQIAGDLSVLAQKNPKCARAIS